MSSEILSFLKSRRSVLARQLTSPGPDEAQLQTLLQIGARVPDHGKLVPWRFIVFQGAARHGFDKKLKEIYKRQNLAAAPEEIELATRCFSRAPLVISVISSFKEHSKVSQWEQQLSAGAVCQNILIAAQSMGFAAQWLTQWYAYDEAVNALLGLTDNERVAGFIYIGTAMDAPKERARPVIFDITTNWNG